MKEKLLKTYYPQNFPIAFERFLFSLLKRLQVEFKVNKPKSQKDFPQPGEKTDLLLGLPPFQVIDFRVTEIEIPIQFLPEGRI